MGKIRNRGKKNRGITLLLSIIFVFCILGTVVFSVAKKISAKMSESAIQNLSASLDLIQGTMEAILTKDGSYNANADIAFSYDGQSIYIPISSTAVLGRTCQLSWNSRMESFGQYLVTGPSY